MMNVETIRRKVTKQDVEEIARLMATRRLTESGCCLIRGIGEKQWWNWKSKEKNKQKFTDLFTRIRESKLDLLVERIESASEDALVPHGEKMITKRGDWRAAAWLTEKIAPERFAQQVNQISESQKPLLLIDAMKRVYASTPLLSPPAARSACDDHNEDIQNVSNATLEDRGNPIKSVEGADAMDGLSVEPQSVGCFNSHPDCSTVRLPVRRIKEAAIESRKRGLPVRRKK